MTGIPPGLLVSLLLILITSQLLHLAWPHRPRRYAAVLVLTCFAFALGQVWDVAGLPAFRVGEASLLPGVLFAVLLQPLARFLPLSPRLPR